MSDKQFEGMELVGKLHDKDLNKISTYHRNAIHQKERFVALSKDELEFEKITQEGFEAIKKEMTEKKFDEAVEVYRLNAGVNKLPKKTREMFGRLMFFAMQYAGVGFARRQCFKELNRFEGKKKEFGQKMFKRYKLDKTFEYTVDFTTGNIYQKPKPPETKNGVVKPKNTSLTNKNK